MGLVIHKSDTRGRAEHGWLSSRHTFSFADYYDLQRMGFGLLRVINDDVVQPGMGFGTHPHKNMEIISIPLTGFLKHKDSMGNEHIIQAGEIQVMSAGTGITIRSTMARIPKQLIFYKYGYSRKRKILLRDMVRKHFLNRDVRISSSYWSHQKKVLVVCGLIKVPIFL